LRPDSAHVETESGRVSLQNSAFNRLVTGSTPSPEVCIGRRNRLASHRIAAIRCTPFGIGPTQQLNKCRTRCTTSRKQCESNIPDRIGQLPSIRAHSAPRWCTIHAVDRTPPGKRTGADCHTDPRMPTHIFRRTASHILLRMRARTDRCIPHRTNRRTPREEPCGRRSRTLSRRMSRTMLAGKGQPVCRRIRRPVYRMTGTPRRRHADIRRRGNHGPTTRPPPKREPRSQAGESNNTNKAHIDST
jgi:hypothetical protein